MLLQQEINLVQSTIEEEEVETEHKESELIKNKGSENIEVGDDVYVLDMQWKKWKGGALQKIYKGPYKVCNVTATRNFKLENNGEILEGSHGRKL